MSTTVKYKGETLATVTNQTRTLNTRGKYLEDNIELTDVTAAAPTLETKTKTYTPTETQQTEAITPSAGYDGLDEVDVTVNAIPANYVGSGVTRRSSSDLTASGATVTAPAGYYETAASKAVAAGSEGTPTATKGTVSNHAVTVTPSVTNQAGYIAGGTKTGTGVQVTAAELVSGSETKTENGTYDVTNLAELVVNVQGASRLKVDMTAAELLAAGSTITFTGLSGQPTSFFLICTDGGATGGTPYDIVAAVYDGFSYHAQTLTNTSNAQVSYVAGGVSSSYSNGVLTVTAGSGLEFAANVYSLTYSYEGGVVDIKDVQVGSGATAITFTGLEDEPAYWSLIFKSNFGASSGYQRVIAVADDTENVVGLEMDSAAHFSWEHWTATYNNGSFTVTSQGTNAGGYFHQPGYYQLTYAYDADGSYQSKVVTPTTAQQVVQADSGYDALKKVTVNPIPSEYIVPSGNLPITSNGNNINVAQYETVSVNVPTGGGSVNVDTKTITNSSASNTSISFTGLSGEPKAFFVRCTAQLTRSSNSSYYYVTDMRWNGSSGNHNGNYWRMSNGTFYNDTSHYSHTYSNGTLTISSSGSRSAAGGSFYNGGYELVYVY